MIHTFRLGSDVFWRHHALDASKQGELLIENFRLCVAVRFDKRLSLFLPAFLVIMILSFVLSRGIRESASNNNVMVAIGCSFGPSSSS